MTEQERLRYLDKLEGFEPLLLNLTTSQGTTSLD